MPDVTATVDDAMPRLLGLPAVGRRPVSQALTSVSARDDARTPRSPYLTAADVADRLRCSTRSVHELTRRRAIPHRVLPGSRRCLFREADLAAWEDGAELEVVEPRHGGRIVRPVTRAVTHTCRLQEGTRRHRIGNPRAGRGACRRPAFPARGDPRAPFGEGNTAAVKHGANRPETLKDADEPAAGPIGAHPHPIDADALAVRSAVIAELRVERIAAWLDEVGGLEPATGDIRPAADVLRRFLVTANQPRASVGLDPRSRAVLAVDELHARRSAADLAAADLEAGRRLRESR